MNNISKKELAKKKTKKLSFEPVFHRRVSQEKYIRLPLRATKGASIEALKSILSERDEILAQGFSVEDIDIDNPLMRKKENAETV